MGIEPHFDLWNYFFCTQLQHGSDAEAVVQGSVDIFVRSGSGVDSYFHFPMSDLATGWRTVWFFLRNDADAPLSIFSGCHPVPELKWGYNVDQQYVRKLQPLCDVIRQLQRGELMGTDLLRTFISCRV
jgi:hypothetical protein